MSHITSANPMFMSSILLPEDNTGGSLRKAEHTSRLPRNQSISCKIMAGRGKAVREEGGSEDEVCVVCFRSVEIYSIGECDHPVCYECSTRMRVLCARNECPICRKDMAKVSKICTKY